MSLSLDELRLTSPRGLNKRQFHAVDQSGIRRHAIHVDRATAPGGLASTAILDALILVKPAAGQRSQRRASPHATPRFQLPFLRARSIRFMARKTRSRRNNGRPPAASAVWSLAAVLLLAAGNPLLQAQDSRTAPADEEAFHGLAVGQRIWSGDPSYHLDFVSRGRFDETEGAQTYAGSYSYSNTGVNTGTIVLNYDDGDRCTAYVVFASTTAGTVTSTCINGQTNWRLTQIPEPAPAGSDEPVSSYEIDTLAGLRVSGDEGPAVEAWLDFPDDVAVDSAGNIYIADRDDHRIRKVDATGTITTIAGNGVQGFAGDGGPAVEAQLSSPQAVAVDGTGNLYIADTFNYRIRKVDSTGTITTVAGNGEFGFAGDGGPASQAQLGEPEGVALDGVGNVYIADTFNYRIRKVDSTGTITTIAGTGEAGFSGDGGPASQAQFRRPWDVAVDGAGNVYIADFEDHRIRKIDAAGTITTIAGPGDGGPASQVRVSYPSGVAVDGAGNLYFESNGGIYKRDAAGTITAITGDRAGFAGDGGPALQAHFRYPSGLAVDGTGNVYIADSQNRRIRKVDTAGTIATIAGRTFSGDGGSATGAQTSYPLGVAVDGLGNLYIADTENHRIRKVDAAGTITTVAGTGESGFSGDGGPATGARIDQPQAVAVDGLGNLYIATAHLGRIRKVDAAGTITTVAGTGESGFSGDGGPAVEAEFRELHGVAVDGLGNLYIADRNNQRIRKVDSAGTVTTVAGNGGRGFAGDGGPASQAQLSEPEGVAVDGAGNLYITDSFNHRIRKVDLTGTISTVAGNGERGFAGDGGPAVEAQLSSPQAVAVDGTGNLYIADTFNGRIRRVDLTGTITTIAGNGERGFAGDGGPAVEARLDLAHGVAVGEMGNLYIADTYNHGIRSLKPPAKLVLQRDGDLAP